MLFTILYYLLILLLIEIYSCVWGGSYFKAILENKFCGGKAENEVTDVEMFYKEGMSRSTLGYLCKSRLREPG